MNKPECLTDQEWRDEKTRIRQMYDQDDAWFREHSKGRSYDSFLQQLKDYEQHGNTLFAAGKNQAGTACRWATYGLICMLVTEFDKEQDNA